LKAALEGHAAPYTYDELDILAKHFTEAEDAANKVERQVSKSAAALLLESRIGEQFDAIVTGASSKGTWVRLLHVPVEDKLVQGFSGLDVGDRVRVQLIATNVERGYIDFEQNDTQVVSQATCGIMRYRAPKSAAREMPWSEQNRSRTF
jgi:exoribonuclease R